MSPTGKNYITDLCDYVENESEIYKISMSIIALMFVVEK